MLSISARARPVTSLMLMVIVACSAAGWTPVERTALCQRTQNHCNAGFTTESIDCVVHDACDQQMLVCCALPAPQPVGQAPLPHAAPLPADAVSASLVDTMPLARSRNERGAHITSPHWVRTLDLSVLHRVFVL